MFKLAERRGDASGPYCGPEGLYLGPSPLIAKFGGSFRLRASDEIAALIEAAYGMPIEVKRLLPRLRLAAEALQRGEIAQAMIAAVQLRLGEIPENRLARIAQLDSLLKYDFDPDEPRDWHGRWTTEGGEDGASGGDGGTDAGGDASDAAGGGGGGGGSSAGGEADTGSRSTEASAEAEGSSQPRPSASERVWERFPNADFRNRLAIAEQTANKPNFGYTELLESPGGNFALGRYQLTQAGLIAAAGNGLDRSAPRHRAAAAGEWLIPLCRDDNRRLVDRFTVTRAGLLAAGHRYGARETREYLDKEASSGFSSARVNLTPADRAVETRLRMFANVRYE